VVVIEVVTTAEIGYRERCVRAFEWRVRRRAKLEEDARNYQLQLEREARERQQQLEQARIDQLLDEAAALRRATDIRDYVGAVNAGVRRDAASISGSALTKTPPGGLLRTGNGRVLVSNKKWRLAVGVSAKRNRNTEFH
jgi:hypothetical protein